MRSELVTGALQRIPNRFLLTQLAAKAIRALHRPKARIAEIANEVFARFGVSNPIVENRHSAVAATAALRRASQV